MKALEFLCNEVLRKAQEKGGRINAATYEQIVGRNAHTFRQVKMKLLALELIEKRDDNKIFLTPKGLNVKSVKQAENKPIKWDKIGAIATFLSIIVAILIAIIAYYF